MMFLIFGNSCGQRKNQSTTMVSQNVSMPAGSKLATFGSGCFWCTEAIFQNVEGVLKVESGYSGGKVKNPTYKEVCSGLTDHAEVIQLTYDPSEITYDELLEIFWETHDPTTLNRQGADVGTQYRSVVYYHDDEQKRLAEEYDLPFLGQIPLVQSIREGGDIGVPAMLTDDEISKAAFTEFAGTVARSVSMRNAHMKSEEVAEVVESEPTL